MRDIQRFCVRRFSRRAATLACAATVVVGLACSAAPGGDGLADKLNRLWERLPFAAANVPWEVVTPEQAGLQPAALDALWDRLAPYETRALLVARGGQLVYERYATGRGANRKLPVAAAAKAVVAGVATQLAIADGRVGIDDPISKFVPEWRDDPQRAGIRVRHVLTHSSGIENVSFSREHTGWKGEYKANRPERFALALRRAPIRFEPGSRYEYSGVSFHALAYALARAFEDSGFADLTALLDARVMQPLDIPPRAWELSYGERYEVDGLRLQAIGSGASFTPRAFARIGQLLLDEGRAGDAQLLPASGVRRMLRYAGDPPQRPRNADVPGMGLALWVNCDGFWPSLPQDAAVIAGSKHQIILLIPSLDVLVVRLGEGLGESSWFGDYWTALGSEFFEPLASALPAGEAAAEIRCDAPGAR